jgi:hypothetical protein
MSGVIIVRGVSGSGKSRYAQTMKEKNNPCIVCSADNHFMVPTGDMYRGEPVREYRFDPLKLAENHQACMNFYLGTLRHGCPLIVVDNTNIHRWEYMNYEEAALLAGYEVSIVEYRVNTIDELKLCIRRNQHRVPADIIAKMAIEFEPDLRAIVKMIES